MYVEVTHDYRIENLGVLKKGIQLRYDEEMDEGFTRYILYLNVKADNFKLVADSEIKSYEIRPFWLYPLDTILKENGK